MCAVASVAYLGTCWIPRQDAFELHARICPAAVLQQPAAVFQPCGSRTDDCGLQPAHTVAERELVHVKVCVDAWRRISRTGSPTAHAVLGAVIVVPGRGGAPVFGPRRLV